MSHDTVEVVQLRFGELWGIFLFLVEFFCRTILRILIVGRYSFFSCRWAGVYVDPDKYFESRKIEIRNAPPRNYQGNYSGSGLTLNRVGRRRRIEDYWQVH